MFEIARNQDLRDKSIFLCNSVYFLGIPWGLPFIQCCEFKVWIPQVNCPKAPLYLSSPTQQPQAKQPPREGFVCLFFLPDALEFEGASLVSQTVKNLPAMQETQFNPWIRKIPWRRKWQPTPVFLPGKYYGQRSLVGYSPWGCKQLDTTE